MELKRLINSLYGLTFPMDIAFRVLVVVMLLYYMSTIDFMNTLVIRITAVCGMVFVFRSMLIVFMRGELLK